MDSIIELIYDMFMKEMRDLEMGHMFEQVEINNIWELIQVYELLDSNILSKKEQNKIIEYYEN